MTANPPTLPASNHVADDPGHPEDHDLIVGALHGALYADNDLSDVGNPSNALMNIGAQAVLVPTTIHTSSYTAAVNDLAKFDVSGASVTQPLPHAPPDKALYSAKIINAATGNTLTLTCQGSDVINKTGGATTYALKLLNQSVLLQYQATGSIWMVLGDDLPLGQLDNRYSMIYGTSTSTSAAKIFSPGATTDCSSLIQNAIDAGATDILLDGNASSPVFYLNGPVFDDSTLNQNLGAGPQQRSITIRGTSNAILQLGPNLPYAAATVDGSGNLTAAAFTPDSTSRWAFFPNTLRSAFTSGTNTVLVNTTTAVSGTSQSAPIGRLRIRDLVIDGGNVSTLNPAGIAYANQCNVHWSDCTVRYLKYGFSWTGYSDRPQMRNINAQMKGQADSGNVTGPVLMYQTSAGDGVLIEGIECAGDWCVWNAFGCRGGIARLPVSSGSYVFSHCDGVTLEGGHAEMTQTLAAYPNITVKNSRINVRNWWWSASVTSAHYGLTINDSASGLYINDASVVTLRDCVSVFLLNARTDPVRTPDINIQSMMLGGSLTVDNFKYMMLDVGGIAEFSGGAPLVTSANSGITAALTTSAVSSHTLAATGAPRWVLRNTGASTTTWAVETIPGAGSGQFLAAVQTPTAATPIAYSAAGTLTNAQTYEYAVGTIADDGSQSGVSSAVSAAASSSGTMRLPVTVLQTPTALIVWRKTGTGVIASPDSFVILPVDSQTIQVLDTGVNANGLPWQTSSIPATASFAGTATPARLYDPVSSTSVPLSTILTGLNQVIAGVGLSGGGSLSSNVTLTAANNASAAQAGLLAMTYQPHIASSTSTALTGGTVYVIRVIAEAAAASGTRTVRFYQIGASSGVTLGQVAVFSSTGTQLGSTSADQSATWNGSGTAVRNPTVGTFALVAGSTYYIAILTVAGTGPTLGRSGNNGVANAGLTGATLLFSTSATTGVTTMPGSLTTSTLAAQPIALWAGLY